jgi:heme exporter protein C
MTLSQKIWLALGVLILALFVTDFYLIFGYAPVAANAVGNPNIAQKIFYFHVPSAFAMYQGFGLCGLASAVWLFTRRAGWDALAVAAGEVGSLFALCVLTSGPIWGMKDWGTAWVWDPQLTATFLTALLFFAYLGLRSFGRVGQTEQRFAAAIAIFAIPLLPLIHYAAQKWGGQHPIVNREGGGGMDSEIATAFLFSTITFQLFAAWLIWTRARLETQRTRVRDLELRAVREGLLEEG